MSMQIEAIESNSQNKFLIFLKAIRVHQYAKNTLIFLPLFTGQLYTNQALFVRACIAFLAFCFLASSIYLINDLIDRDADRQHRTKRKRPIAAGHFSMVAAKITIALFLCMAFILATQLNWVLTSVLCCYLFLTQAYTFYFKKRRLFDIVLLSLFYVIRILAGIAAIGSEYSLWLLLFSLFFCLSLACIKRYTEIYLSKQQNQHQIIGRGYTIQHLNSMQIIGVLCAFTALIIFGIYTCSHKAHILYAHAERLWIVEVLLSFWIIKMWWLTIKGSMLDDPVTYALRDKTSLFIFSAIIWTFIMAS